MLTSKGGGDRNFQLAMYIRSVGYQRDGLRGTHERNCSEHQFEWQSSNGKATAVVSVQEKGQKIFAIYPLDDYYLLIGVFDGS